MRLFARNPRRLMVAAEPWDRQVPEGPKTASDKDQRLSAVGVASAATVGGAMYATLVRPRISRWGATD